MGWAFAPLAKLRFLRGTIIDPFGYTQERRMERRMIEDYAQRMEHILAAVNSENHALALEFAALPQGVRGYGHVKEKNAQNAARRGAELLAAMGLA